MTVYAKKIPAERQTSPIAYGDIPDGVYVFGNDYGALYGGEIIDELIEMLIDASDALASEEEQTEDVALDVIRAVVAEFLPAPERKKEYTTSDLLMWREILTDLFGGDIDTEDAVCDALHLIDGVVYDWGTIHGSVQREWAKVIYPARFSGCWLSYFGKEFFNTGDEWEVSYAEDEDGELFYTHEWSEEGQADEIAAEFGCAPCEVVFI